MAEFTERSALGTFTRGGEPRISRTISQVFESSVFDREHGFYGQFAWLPKRAIQADIWKDRRDATLNLEKLKTILDANTIQLVENPIGIYGTLNGMLRDTTPISLTGLRPSQEWRTAVLYVLGVRRNRTIRAVATRPPLTSQCCCWGITG
jgi:hypothetical protein